MDNENTGSGSIPSYDVDRQRALLRTAFSGGVVTDYNRPPELTFVKVRDIDTNGGGNKTGTVRSAGSSMSGK